MSGELKEVTRLLGEWAEGGCNSVCTSLLGRGKLCRHARARLALSQINDALVEIRK